MKPIRTLSLFQKATNPVDAIKAFLKLTENPKRHLRGPRFGLRPGTGKIQPTNKEGTVTTAVCGCANGIIDMVCKGGREGEVAQDTRNLLNETITWMYGDNPEIVKGFETIPIKSFATLSDKFGLKAIRKVLLHTLSHPSIKQ